MMNNKLMVTMLCMLIGGCTNTRISQSFSSGAIGCPAEDIKITNEEAGAFTGIHDWIAECNGRKYACNYIYHQQATCTEIKG